MIVFSDHATLAIPNYYGIRLFDDSISAIYGEQSDSGDVAHYTSKRRLVLAGSDRRDEGTATSYYPLDAIFLLSDPSREIEPEQVEITEATGADTMMKLVAQTFVLDVTDKELMAKQFRNCGQLFEHHLPCYNLDHPRDHDRLDEVRKTVEQVVTNGLQE
jgi:hypothetical protein